MLAAGPPGVRVLGMNGSAWAPSTSAPAASRSGDPAARYSRIGSYPGGGAGRRLRGSRASSAAGRPGGSLPKWARGLRGARRRSRRHRPGARRDRHSMEPAPRADGERGEGTDRAARSAVLGAAGYGAVAAVVIAGWASSSTAAPRRRSTPGLLLAGHRDRRTPPTASCRSGTPTSSAAFRGSRRRRAASSIPHVLYVVLLIHLAFMLSNVVTWC